MKKLVKGFWSIMTPVSHSDRRDSEPRATDFQLCGFCLFLSLSEPQFPSVEDVTVLKDHGKN